MGVYIYKTLSKHVNTPEGPVYEAKYVTKPGLYSWNGEPKLGRPGKTGDYLMALELSELEPVHQVRSAGGHWYDSALDRWEQVGWLRKEGRRWVISDREPTRGEWLLKGAESTGKYITGCMEERLEVIVEDGKYLLTRTDIVSNKQASYHTDNRANALAWLEQNWR
jgi:hypothetical protein